MFLCRLLSVNRSLSAYIKIWLLAQYKQHLPYSLSELSRTSQYDQLSFITLCITIITSQHKQFVTQSCKIPLSPDLRRKKHLSVTIRQMLFSKTCLKNHKSHQCFFLARISRRTASQYSSDSPPHNPFLQR